MQIHVCRARIGLGLCSLGQIRLVDGLDYLLTLILLWPFDDNSIRIIDNFLLDEYSSTEGSMLMCVDAL